MPSDLKANYPDIESASTGFANEASRIKQILQNLKRSADPLRNSWIGKGAQTFFQEMESSVLPEFSRLEKVMTELSSKTKTISQIFQTAEQEAAQMVLIHGNGSAASTGETAGGTSTAGGGSGGTPGGGPGGAANTVVEANSTATANVPADVRARWNSMTQAERIQALQNAANGIAKQYGMGSIPVNVMQIPDPPGADARGSWDGSKINIDVDNLNDPDVVFNTLAHESRHAFQEKMSNLIDPSPFDAFLRKIGLQPTPQWPQQGVTEQTAQSWDDNYENYHSPPASGYDASDPANVAAWDAYMNQPIEVDARAAGDRFVNNLTLAQLETYIPKPTPTPVPVPTPGPAPVTPTPTPTPKPSH